MLDSGLSLEYNQLKNTLLQYLRNNYQEKGFKDLATDVKDFKLPQRFLKILQISIILFS